MLERLLPKPTHCAVEWDEPGNPRSVVLSGHVSGIDEDRYEVGKLSCVMVREGKKMIPYNATVLGEGT